jgi:hypothetical protein
MRVVVSVVAGGRSWRIHVDLDDGGADLYRDTEYVGRAVYVPRAGWRSLDPDRADVREALQGAVRELLPFEAVMLQRRQPPPA